MGWREQRVAENESRFRSVNERLRDLAVGETGSAADRTEALVIICECADAECTDRIRIALGDYEWVRAASARFVIVPGHGLPAIERLARRAGGYDVVEKTGEARETAAELDPRT